MGVETVWSEMADDESLAQRAKSDPAAFAPLYRRYARPIYGYCARRLDSRELAEDATSQVFLRALGAIGGYRGDAFRSWLFTIAHHVVVDHYRRLKPADPLDDAFEIASGEASPEEVALHREDARNVRRLLAKLTPEQRGLAIGLEGHAAGQHVVGDDT